MNLYRLPALIAIVTCLCGTASFAASSDWVENGPNRLRLVIAEPEPGAAEVRAALDIDLAPGWKTYWQDPGDAGVPLQFSLDGSDNAANPVVQFPLPKRFDDGVTVWAGYDAPVQIPVTFTRNIADKAGTVSASVFLGICENICIPVEARFAVPFGNGEKAVADTFMVNQAHARLPEPADAQNGVGDIAFKDGQLLVSTAMSEQAASELFIAAPKGWQFSAPTIAGMDGVKSKFVAKVLYQADKTASGTVTIGYTLSNGKKAVSGSAEFVPQ